MKEQLIVTEKLAKVIETLRIVAESEGRKRLGL